MHYHAETATVFNCKGSVGNGIDAIERYQKGFNMKNRMIPIVKGQRVTCYLWKVIICFLISFLATNAWSMIQLLD